MRYNSKMSTIMDNDIQQSWIQIFKTPLINEQVAGFQWDSRNVHSGDIFFALKGQKSDGHNHLQEVAQRGGVGAVVDRQYSGSDFGLQLYRVLDVHKTVHQLAKDVIERRHPKIVGITGSLGKTTTKEYISHLLTDAVDIYVSPKSYNSQITFPFNILNAPKKKIYILEMGVSFPGEMQKLVDIASPDIVVMTPFASAHIDSMGGSLENIAKEKAKIFTKHTRFAYIYQENLVSLPLPTDLNYVSYGNEAAQCFYENEKGRNKFFVCQEKRYPLPQLTIPKHLQQNVLPAILLAQKLGMKWEEIVAKLPTLPQVAMRFEPIQKNKITIINDAYNANPVSMASALKNLPSCEGKKIAILGHMTGLGVLSQQEHQKIGKIATKYVDILLCYGKETLALYDAFGKKEKYHFLSKEDLLEAFKQISQEGDVVLVKGSRDMKMEEIIHRI